MCKTSNIFSSETAGPRKLKLCMQLPTNEDSKNCNHAATITTRRGVVPRL